MVPLNFFRIEYSFVFKAYTSRLDHDSLIGGGERVPILFLGIQKIAVLPRPFIKKVFFRFKCVSNNGRLLSVN
jgi:hypothetical protein